MFCGQCGNEVRSDAQFCGSCGEPTRPAKAPARRRRGRDPSDRQATRAIGVIFGGLIAVMTALSISTLGDVETDLILMAGEVAVGVLALQLMGERLRSGVLAGPTTVGDLGLGLVTALGTIAVSWGFVTVLIEAGFDDEEWVPSTWEMIVVIVAAPLLEEWLCRGVLWRALTPFTGFAERNIATALLFAMLHCLGGMLNFPHRFVGGLALGWLRHRSGSLIPCVVSHAMHNALAVALTMA